MTEPASSPAPTKADKLAALRAARAELESARQEAAAASAEDIAIAAAEQALADEQAWDAAVKQHGADAVSRVDTVCGLVIVKRPDGADFRKFSDKPTTAMLDLEQLVFPCRVYPDKFKFGAWIDKQPGILLDCSTAVAALAGVKRAASAKK